MLLVPGGRLICFRTMLISATVWMRTLVSLVRLSEQVPYPATIRSLWNAVVGYMSWLDKILTLHLQYGTSVTDVSKE